MEVEKDRLLQRVRVGVHLCLCIPVSVLFIIFRFQV